MNLSKSVESAITKAFDKMDELNKTSQINAVNSAMNGAISVVEDCESIEHAKFILPHFRDAIIQKMKITFNENKESK